jgi:hypothetical protein
MVAAIAIVAASGCASGDSASRCTGSYMVDVEVPTGSATGDCEAEVRRGENVARYSFPAAPTVSTASDACGEVPLRRDGCAVVAGSGPSACIRTPCYVRFVAAEPLRSFLAADEFTVTVTCDGRERGATSATFTCQRPL